MAARKQDHDGHPPSYADDRTGVGGNRMTNSGRWLAIGSNRNRTNGPNGLPHSCRDLKSAIPPQPLLGHIGDECYDRSRRFDSDLARSGSPRCIARRSPHRPTLSAIGVLIVPYGTVRSRSLAPAAVGRNKAAVRAATPIDEKNSELSATFTVVQTGAPANVKQEIWGRRGRASIWRGRLTAFFGLKRGSSLRKSSAKRRSGSG